MTTTTKHRRPDAIAPGTRVLYTKDGEAGSIVSAVAFNADAGWTEYEVETLHGIEVWLRADFVLRSEIFTNE